MKKALEAELLSIAHRILQMKNKDDVNNLYKEAKEVYEKLSILKFYDNNINIIKSDLSEEELENKIENAYAIQGEVLNTETAIVENNDIEEEFTDQLEEEINEETVENTDIEEEFTVQLEEEISEETVENTDIEEGFTVQLKDEVSEELSDNDRIEEDIIQDEEVLFQLEKEIDEELFDNNIHQEEDILFQFEQEENEESSEKTKIEEDIHQEEEVIFQLEDEIDEEVLFQLEEEENRVSVSEEELESSSKEEKEVVLDEELLEVEDALNQHLVNHTGVGVEIFLDLDDDENTKSIEDSLFGMNYNDVEFIEVNGIAEETIEEIIEKKEVIKEDTVAEKSANEDLFEAAVDHSYIDNTDKQKSINDSFSRIITVGLNDRIAFEKHLFNGSSEDFNRVLSQLNTFDSLEDASSFIEDLVKPDYNYWEGKDEYSARFMELIEKRFI